MFILTVLTEPFAPVLTSRSVENARNAVASGDRTGAGGASDGDWRATIARWIARSRQRRALREIADANDIHLLKDIGVSREEALRESDKPFWRP